MAREQALSDFGLSVSQVSDCTAIASITTQAVQASGNCADEQRIQMHGYAYF
jgi:hypothetical protein